MRQAEVKKRKLRRQRKWRRYGIRSERLRMLCGEFHWSVEFNTEAAESTEKRKKRVKAIRRL